MSNWLRFLSVRSVFWRKLHFWGVNNFPPWLMPISMVWISLAFYLAWRSGRIGLTRNLAIIFPGQPVRNFFRGARVVWNFSWSMTDTWSFLDRREPVDWEIEGEDQLEALSRIEGGAILLTAHMGNYDLGAYIFTERTGRRLSVVRLPEVDQRTEELAREKRRTFGGDGLSVAYNLSPESMGIELLNRLRAGEIVAIQGDRSYPGVASRVVSVFGCEWSIPSGPFQLAMVAGVPIIPLFVVRSGLHRYRVIAFDPIHVARPENGGRDPALERAAGSWAAVLERILTRWWHQWASFYEVRT